MNAEQYLSMNLAEVKWYILKEAFDAYAEHCKVTPEQRKKANLNLREMRKMNISLSCALTTAFALAKM